MKNLIEKKVEAAKVECMQMMNTEKMQKLISEMTEEQVVGMYKLMMLNVLSR